MAPWHSQLLVPVGSSIDGMLNRGMGPQSYLPSSALKEMGSVPFPSQHHHSRRLHHQRAFTLTPQPRERISSTWLAHINLKRWFVFLFGRLVFGNLSL